MSALRPSVALGAGFGLVLAAVGLPAIANEKPGRYSLQAIEGGILRLDTETGQMTLCTRKDTTLVCEPVGATGGPDRDSERLAAEVRELKAEIKRLEEHLAQDGNRRPGGRHPRLELPSEADVDKALTYMERMLRKFKDKIKELEGAPGRGTQL